jgi:hypothetical protein
LPTGHWDNEIRGPNYFFGQRFTPVRANINTESGQELSQNEGGPPIPATIPDAR